MAWAGGQLVALVAAAPGARLAGGFFTCSVVPAGAYSYLPVPSALGQFVACRAPPGNWRSGRPTRSSWLRELMPSRRDRIVAEAAAIRSRCWSCPAGWDRPNWRADSGLPPYRRWRAALKTASLATGGRRVGPWPRQPIRAVIAGRGIAPTRHRDLTRRWPTRWSARPTGHKPGEARPRRPRSWNERPR
jgi:hypothetical protein